MKVYHQTVPRLLFIKMLFVVDGKKYIYQNLSNLSVYMKYMNYIPYQKFVYQKQQFTHHQAQPETHGIWFTHIPETVDCSPKKTSHHPPASPGLVLMPSWYLGT